LSRIAHEWSETFIAIAAALHRLGRDILIDGEAVAHGDNGFPDFDLLPTKHDARSRTGSCLSDWAIANSAAGG